jgi:hypothetical protein
VGGDSEEVMMMTGGRWSFETLYKSLRPQKDSQQNDMSLLTLTFVDYWCWKIPNEYVTKYLWGVGKAISKYPEHGVGHDELQITKAPLLKQTGKTSEDIEERMRLLLATLKGDMTEKECSM